MSEEITNEKALMVEAEVRRWWEYVEKAYEEARREWNNTLQWLFAVIAGGVGLAATMFEKEFPSIAFGLLLTAGWCSWIAYDLLRKGRSQEMQPPGFEANSLTPDYLAESDAKLRHLMARGLDERIKMNNDVVLKLTKAVDTARMYFSWVPGVGVGGVVAWCIIGQLCRALYKLAFPYS